MSDIEETLKKMILAGIGAAAATREQAESALRELVSKGEEVVDQSGIRNEALRRDPQKASCRKDDGAQAAESLLERLRELTPEQLRALKEAIAAMEKAGGENGHGDAAKPE